LVPPGAAFAENESAPAESATPQQGDATSLRIRSLGDRDSIDLRFGGLIIEVEPDSGDRQLVLESVTRTLEATQIVARTAQLRIRASNEALSPLVVRADTLRLQVRPDELHSQVSLGLFAEGNVRLMFGDADARCMQASLSMRTTSQQHAADDDQDYAELLLDHGVDISRVRDKERLFLRGEHARIHLAANGLSLTMASVELVQPLAGHNTEADETVKDLSRDAAESEAVSAD
jgi:hypothetical protein